MMELDEAIEDTAKKTRRYAKRQMTWFRGEAGVRWFRGFGAEPQVIDGAVRFVEARICL